jgi:hypothetical protein
MKSATMNILFLMFLGLSVPTASACGYKYDAISTAQDYRAEGPTLLGSEKSNRSVVQSRHLPTRPQALAHEFPFLVDSSAEFLLNLRRQKVQVVAPCIPQRPPSWLNPPRVSGR